MARIIVILALLVVAPFLGFSGLFLYEMSLKADRQGAGAEVSSDEVAAVVTRRLEKRLDRLETLLRKARLDAGESGPLEDDDPLPEMRHTPVDFGEGKRAAPRFRYAIGAVPKHIDPARFTGAMEGRIAEALFEGLTTYHPETLEPLPGVAKAWTISDDELTYTFFLRDDAVWSNGQPVTAEDFVYSFQRVLAPKTASEYSYILYPIKNARVINLYRDWLRFFLISGLKPANPVLRFTLDDVQAFTEPLLSKQADAAPPSDQVRTALRGLEDEKVLAGSTAEGAEFEVFLGKHALESSLDLGVTAKDAHTLVITLKSATSYFLDLTSFSTYLPVNRQCVESWGDHWTEVKNIVTNGPFLLHSVETEARYMLRRNPNYWDADRVRTQEIEILVVEDQNTQMNLFEKGKIDYPDSVPPQIIDSWKNKPEMHISPALTTYYFRINVTRPPFNDPDKGPLLRRALNLAVDRAQICDYIMRAGQIPAGHYVPPGITGYESPPDQGMRFDPAAAQKLLAQAGYPGGRGMPEIQILYNTSDAHQKVAATLQNMWIEHLGIPVSLRNMEWKIYLDAQDHLDYDVCRAGWIGDYSDPNTFLDMFITGGGNNDTGWSNERYDRIINKHCADISGILKDEEDRRQLIADAPRAASLVEKWLSAADSEKRDIAYAVRFAAFQEAEALLLAEAPIIPIYYYVNINVFRDTVHNITGNVRNVIPLKWVWVEER